MRFLLVGCQQSVLYGEPEMIFGDYQPVGVEIGIGMATKAGEDAAVVAEIGANRQQRSCWRCSIMSRTVVFGALRAVGVGISTLNMAIFPSSLATSPVGVFLSRDGRSSVGRATTGHYLGFIVRRVATANG